MLLTISLILFYALFAALLGLALAGAFGLFE